MKNLILLLRPQQWVKNLFVFFPLFFSGHLKDIHLLIITIFVFISYCFVASAVYCFNDIHDIKNDKRHPEKSKRPLASGTISPKIAYIEMIVCLIIGFIPLLWIQEKVDLFLIIAAYFILNIAYTVKLKQHALIDVFILSFGFVLRVLAGGLATNIWISEWIVIMAFLIALFLAFAKRRDDLILFEQTGVLTRKNVINYNTEFLNMALIITATVTMVAYIMYSISEDVIKRLNSNYIYYTSFFVLIGVLRYLQLVFVLGQGGNPTKILWKDRFLQLCILGWIGVFLFILYL